KSLCAILARPPGLVEVYLQRNLMLNGQLNEEGKVTIKTDFFMAGTSITFRKPDEELGARSQLLDQFLSVRIYRFQAEYRVEADVDINLFPVFLPQLESGQHGAVPDIWRAVDD